MDGLTAVRQIRKMEASGELPGGHNWIFALTGNAREGQIENIRNAGMDDVLVRNTFTFARPTPRMPFVLLVANCSRCGVQIKPYRIDDIMARIRSTRRSHGP